MTHHPAARRQRRPDAPNIHALATAIGAVALLGCSDDIRDSALGPTAGPAGTSASGGSGPTGTGSGPVFGVDPGSAGSTAVAPGNGSLEGCDGIDNDANGIIDDVDLGGDGVCDCLNIATIGEIGPWSDGGNLFATWLDQRSPIGAVALGDQVLTDQLLAPFQVIVVLYSGTQALTGNNNSMLAGHHAFSADETAAFQRWVEGGGGVMTTIGYHGDEATEVVNVNSLLATVGAGYSTANLGLSGFVQDWTPHPLTDGVSNIFTDNGVEPNGNGTSLAQGGNNNLALQITEPGTGHVVVWGDEWITYDSEWQDVTDQQVERFWLNILSWLSPIAECQVPIPIELR